MLRTRPGTAFTIATLVALALVAAPILGVLIGFWPGSAVALALHAGRDALRVSLLASAGATLAATLLGVPTGYALAHAVRPLRASAVFVLALPLAFPPVASGLMLLNLLGRQAPIGAWLAAHGAPVPDTLLGVAVAEFFVSGSLVALAATAAFASLDPIFADAARTLGIRESRIFTRIALPGAAGGISAGIAFAWLRALGEYGATSILAYHPTSLPVALYVALSASGVRQALALCYGFVLIAAVVLGARWVLRRGVVM